jgi:hypothetical protein
MLRRSCLKLIAGACALASAGASAAEPPRTTVAAPATVDEALRTGRPDAVLSFVLTHRDAVAKATNEQKARLLGLLNIDQGGCQKIRSREAFESAAWLVLYGRGTRPEQMRAILRLADPSGARLGQIAASVRHAQLRATLNAAAAT